PPPRSTLFPYTTLFRSHPGCGGGLLLRGLRLRRRRRHALRVGCRDGSGRLGGRGTAASDRLRGRERGRRWGPAPAEADLVRHARGLQQDDRGDRRTERPPWAAGHVPGLAAEQEPRRGGSAVGVRARGDRRFPRHRPPVSGHDRQRRGPDRRRGRLPLPRLRRRSRHHRSARAGQERRDRPRTGLNPHGRSSTDACDLGPISSANRPPLSGGIAEAGTAMAVPARVASDDPILQLPKVSLHDHLDGGLRPETMIELADRIGHTLPADDAESLRRWFSESANSGDLVRYLETFSHTVALMQDREGLRRVAKEWVLDQVADGVFYAETRWAPEQHLGGGLELDEAVEAVQEGLEAGVSEAAAEGKYIR